MPRYGKDVQRFLEWLKKDGRLWLEIPDHITSPEHLAALMDAGRVDPFGRQGERHPTTYIGSRTDLRIWSTELIKRAVALEPAIACDLLQRRGLTPEQAEAVAIQAALSSHEWSQGDKAAVGAAGILSASRNQVRLSGQATASMLYLFISNLPDRPQYPHPPFIANLEGMSAGDWRLVMGSATFSPGWAEWLLSSGAFGKEAWLELVRWNQNSPDKRTPPMTLAEMRRWPGYSQHPEVAEMVESTNRRVNKKSGKPPDLGDDKLLELLEASERQIVRNMFYGTDDENPERWQRWWERTAAELLWKRESQWSDAVIARIIHLGSAKLPIQYGTLIHPNWGKLASSALGFSLLKTNYKHWIQQIPDNHKAWTVLGGAFAENKNNTWLGGIPLEGLERMADNYQHMPVTVGRAVAERLTEARREEKARVERKIQERAPALREARQARREGRHVRAGEEVQIKWPAVEEILERLRTTPMKTLAAEIGVSDTAIRHHLEARNVDLTTLPRRKIRARQ